MLGCADRFYETSAVIEFHESLVIFVFRPIWPSLALADQPLCTSLSGLREELKYSIGKLGYASVRAESGTQRQLK